MSFQSPPLIETKRLLLRAHRLDDFPACAAMWSDPAIVRHITGVPSTQQATWFRMMRYLGHWPLLGFGYWAIEEQSSGAFVGELGFADFKRDMEPSISGVPELGWVVTGAMQGKGYASEALQAVVAWGDTSLDSKRTVCIITPDNAASLHIARKCGFTEWTRTALSGDQLIVFERSAAPAQDV